MQLRSAVATTNLVRRRGPLERFMMPEPAEAKRASDLWQTTCFEAFLRALGVQGYREWNFAPSTKWAVYDFNHDGAGIGRMRRRPEPYIRLEDNFTWWVWGRRSQFPPNTE